MISVLITDDDPFIRESLKMILETEQDITVVGTCSNGEEAYRFCLQHHVDVVLMDIRMPICNGVEASKLIKQERPAISILFLTTFDDDEYIIEAFHAGMSGYLLKNLPPKQIMEGIKLVTEGHMLIHPSVAKKIPHFLNSNHMHQIDLSSYGITTTELNIIERIADGLSNKEIAKALFLSEGTIKNYITQILIKLGLRDRTQVAIFFLKNSSRH